MVSNDSDFLQVLSIDKLKADYLDELHKAIKKIKDRYREEESPNKKKRKEEIERDKQHRRILNASIFPFSHEDSLKKYKYRFVRASPLTELGIKNFDFLLFNFQDPYECIFGEAKGNINDEERIIIQSEERIKNVLDRNDYIKETYINGANADNEFIISVPFTHSSQIAKSILRKNKNIKVWSIGIAPGTSEPLINLEIPYVEKPNSARDMKHKNPNFNYLISNTISTSYSYKSVYIDSHYFAKLSLIIITKKHENSVFAYGDLLNVVKEEMDYLDDNLYLEKETTKILILALQIGFLEYTTNHIENEDSILNKSTFRITSRFKSPENQEKDLELKWIKFSIECDMNEEIKQTKQKIQDKYRKLRENHYRTMDDYQNNLRT